MDLVTLIVSLVVIVLLGALVFALFTKRTNATGVWAKFIQVCQAIDALPVSGALLTALRSPEFITLIIAFVVYAAVAVNPAMAGMQNQLFVVTFGGWLVLLGRMTISDWLTGKYNAPQNPAAGLNDVGKQMLNDLIAAALPVIASGAKANMPVTINTIVAPTAVTTSIKGNVSGIS